MEPASDLYAGDALGRLGRGWGLVDMSLGVIRKDKEILIFPLLSLVSTGIIFIGFIYFTTGGLSLLMAEDFNPFASPTRIVTFVPMYFLLYFIIVYLNVALISCAMIRFEGGDPTVRDGFRTSNQNLRSIFEWVLFASTVGIILMVIEEKVVGVGKIITRVAEMAWRVATYFTVPVLIYEKMSPLGAVRRSADLLRRTWGETIAGGLGMGAIFGLLGLAGLLPAAIGFAVGGIFIALIIAVFYWLALACLSSAATSVFNVALYRYATTGKVVPDFPEEVFKDPWGMYERTTLFEDSGIVLTEDEKAVRRGICQGKVPREVQGKKVKWDYAYDGEMVLTNRRLIVLGDLWGSPVLFPDLKLENLIAVRVADKKKLLLSMDLGTGKTENILLEVNEPSEWVDAIRSQLSVLGE